MPAPTSLKPSGGHLGSEAPGRCLAGIEPLMLSLGAHTCAVASLGEPGPPRGVAQEPLSLSGVSHSRDKFLNICSFIF